MGGSRGTKSENISDFMFHGSAGGWGTHVFLSIECMSSRSVLGGKVEMLTPTNVGPLRFYSCGSWEPFACISQTCLKRTEMRQGFQNSAR